MTKIGLCIAKLELERPVLTAAALAICGSPVVNLGLMLLTPDMSVRELPLSLPLMAIALFPAHLWGARTHNRVYRWFAPQDVPAIREAVFRGKPIQDARLAPAVITVSQDVLRRSRPVVAVLIGVAIAVLVPLLNLASDGTPDRKTLAAVSGVVLGLLLAVGGYLAITAGKRRAQAANDHAQQLLNQQPSDQDRA